MNITELLQQHPNVTISVTGTDLTEFANNVASNTAKAILDKQEEKLYTRNEVIELFGTSPATLWRWSKNGLIKPKKIGGKVFYSESEIKKLVK